jgi:hypothetical protein
MKSNDCARCLVIFATVVAGTSEASTNTSGLSKYGKAVHAAIPGGVWERSTTTWLPVYRGPDVISYGNTLPDGWLLQTPGKSYWGKHDLGKTHSDWFTNVPRNLIRDASEWADIATLMNPQGSFADKIKEALASLEAARKPVTVRILIGMSDDAKASGLEAIQALAKKLKYVKVWTALHKLSVYGPSAPYYTWNHSKIIAIDGKHSMVGGHNLWSEYLNTYDTKWSASSGKFEGKLPPPHDVSMLVDGDAARDAHVFANRLWKEVCTPALMGSRVWTNQAIGACPKDYIPAAHAAGTGGIPILALGRPSPSRARIVTSAAAEINPVTGGELVDASAHDAQLHAIFRSAVSSIYVSQQDLGPIKKIASLKTFGDLVDHGGWPFAWDLADAALRGVDVKVVVGETMGDYRNGWSVAETALKIYSIAKSIYAGRRYPKVSSGNLRNHLCKYLHVAGFRSAPQLATGEWSRQENHAKVIVVDRSAFYVGSQNLYWAHLAELGYFVDNAPAAEEFSTNYWDFLWKYSSPHAVSGEGAPAGTCVFP